MGEEEKEEAGNERKEGRDGRRKDGDAHTGASGTRSRRIICKYGSQNSCNASGRCGSKNGRFERRSRDALLARMLRLRDPRSGATHLLVL